MSARHLHAWKVNVSRYTTPEDVIRAFGPIVEKVVDSTDKTYWKTYTVFIKDSCVDDLFAGTTFHSLFDRFVLYNKKNKKEYWDVELIRV